MDDRWRSRKIAAASLRTAIFVVPLAAGFVVGSTVAGALPETETASDVAIWWLAVIASSTIAATLTDRLARRLLPLTILLKMTMLFPDRAPSRMRVALRSGNFTELRKRIDMVQSGANSDVGEMSELILSLSTALSRHDRKTRGHSERTRAYTDIIAEEMGLPLEARDRLRWAALLHDVGKLEVPAEILNKDSTLTPDEWNIVKQHPVYGMKLVAPLVPWLGEWAKTIEHHHERYDGTGYPHGLAGTRIALGARIVAVGDAYDVMTSGRTYQTAKTPAAARAEIASMSGSQFDPVVVRALMNVSLGRLQWTAGPLAMLAELPFIRGLPQVGRDAATLLTSSALMATSMAAGIIPPPAEFLPSNVVDAVAAAGEFALPADTETPEPSLPGQDDPGPTATITAPTSTTTTIVPVDDPVSTTEPPNTTSTTAPPSPTIDAPAGGPVASPDSASTEEDSPVSIDVLGNDSDPDHDLDVGSLRIIANPADGSAVVDNGVVTYQPSTGHNGTDTFTYAICNSALTCSDALVTITITAVNHPPVANTTSASLDEDTLLTLALDFSDADDDTLTCQLAGSPTSGAATVPANCTRLVFQPPMDYAGEVSVPIRVTDGINPVDFSVAVTVLPVNDAPVAADDTASTDWVRPVLIPVLDNDVDVDGDALNVTITTPPRAGSASVSGSAIRFVPAIRSAAVQTIGYRICDPSGECDEAVVTVTVAAATVTRDDSARTSEGSTVVIRVIENDIPGNGEWSQSSLRIVSTPDHGRAQVLSGGRIRYTPDSRYRGTDSFTYEHCDTAGSCDTATVTVRVRS